jgi:hypothetical protein
VEWIQNEQYPWYRRKWWAVSSSVISKCKLSWVVGMSAVSVAKFVIFLGDHIESNMSHVQYKMLFVNWI